ncbi:long-chain-fatty-acid--CoA ligase (plasmid) [Diaphorobacter sp. HDW4B]|uniref:long-chain-fatty-acid--CoA ligase n=1 Tax=Diaphorobacter sp. HDW4B TaxID=2714925 RepID=UPI00140C3F2B|nr:long-chain-fatty-acid--CoA ligase [Diaphorobacter sp. HDW4B]QIL74004.1 long-chain-fatty-acid--CoA ligase [Diaphorobacter sp. HDW4B]
MNPDNSTNAPFVPRFDNMLFVGDYATHGAKRFSDRIAILGDTGQLSYRELDEASNRFAHHLLARGFKPGARVGYLGKNSELLFVALFGCIRAGCVLVPINWRYALPEVTYVSDDAELALLIYGPEVAPVAIGAGEKLGAKLALMSTVEPSGNEPSFQQVIGAGPSTRPVLNLDPDDGVLQLYTSGTTGKPKGVVLSHRAISIARWVEMGAPAWADWNDDDVILSAMPNFHSGGLAWMLIGMLRSLTCVLTADPSPANLLALSVRHDVTRTFIVPSVVRLLLDAVEASGEPAPPIKTIYYGAAPMDTALIARCIKVFGQCGFGQFYGMTETAGSVTFLAPGEHDVTRPERLRSVGRALPCYDIEIRDPSGKALQPGEHGELWVRTPTMMKGYWQLPDATSEALLGDWYRTGDGAYMDAEGYVFLTDRIKDMIITGGENVYPIEVEAALRLHPAIGEVVVVGVPDEKWGESICAVVEWRAGKSATLEELREFARQHIAAYKLPRVLRDTALLPRTATGKLQRGEVRKQTARW